MIFLKDYRRKVFVEYINGFQRLSRYSFHVFEFVLSTKDKSLNKQINIYLSRYIVQSFLDQSGKDSLELCLAQLITILAERDWIDLSTNELQTFYIGATNNQGEEIKIYDNVVTILGLNIPDSVKKIISSLEQYDLDTYLENRILNDLMYYEYLPKEEKKTGTDMAINYDAYKLLLGADEDDINTAIRNLLVDDFIYAQRYEDLSGIQNYEAASILNIGIKKLRSIKATYEINISKLEFLPEDIVEFSKIGNVSKPSPQEWLTTMQLLSEDEVKAKFCEILKEIPQKDWPGELNDLFASSLFLKENRVTAAFLLKGPGNGFKEMELNTLGKRNDQIIRLAQSPADLIIVQHCHNISENVRTTLKVFATQYSKKYILIDGKDTWRILKAYNKI